MYTSLQIYNCSPLLNIRWNKQAMVFQHAVIITAWHPECHSSAILQHNPDLPSVPSIAHAADTPTEL